jgi:hypothetical protein
VASGQLDEVSLNADTWESYLQTRPLDRLNRRIAAVNQAEIFPTPLGAFLPVLIALQMRTLGDVQRFIDSNADDAYLLAVTELGVTDLDILTESVGLQNLCIVQALKMGGGRPAIVRILDAVSTFGDNEVLAQSIYNHASALPFMNNK